MTCLVGIIICYWSCIGVSRYQVLEAQRVPTSASAIVGVKSGVRKAAVPWQRLRGKHQLQPQGSIQYAITWLSLAAFAPDAHDAADFMLDDNHPLGAEG